MSDQNQKQWEKKEKKIWLNSTEELKHNPKLPKSKKTRIKQTNKQTNAFFNPILA